MPRRSRAGKQDSHERILDAAARQLRAGGPESLSVNALMKQAGLTHGAFYRHFPSREALVQAAIARAATNSSLFGPLTPVAPDAGQSPDKARTRAAGPGETVGARTRVGSRRVATAPGAGDGPPKPSDAALSVASGREALAAAIARYLSPKHRDNLASGCAIAALAADMARLGDAQASRPVRELAELGFERVQAALGAGATRDDAVFIWSAMLGGLMLSRVFGDDSRSDAILDITRRRLAAMLPEASPKSHPE